MKHNYAISLFINLSALVFISFFLSTCEKPERDNPWDALSKLAPGSWAPENLEVERVDLTSARLTWIYSDYNIEGFKLDRRIGEGEWQVGYMVLGKEGRTLTDNDIVPEHGLKYYYRLYAFAGDNESTSRFLVFDASAPLPFDFRISVLSPTSVSLSWNYDHHSHDGFRLARKRNEEDWQESFAELGKDDESYNDQQVDLVNNSYRYRLSVYIGEYASENVEAYIYRPTLSTTQVTGITSTSATSGGNITDPGSSPVSSRGIVWGTEQNPTLEDNGGLTEDGTGTGEFTSELTGLQSGTTYYVRAYATNSIGTAYGEQVSFTTGSVIPAVTTSAITNITSTSATGGGNVTSSGGSSVTARGVVWSTFENPDINSNEGITEDGSGTGEFTSELTGLHPGTTYYVRAYATNSAGTAYGNQVEFTTLDDDEDDWPRDTETQVVEVTNPATGRVWMDRNLGASRAATSSTDAQAYGHLYQWGRAADGHQIRTSGTTSTLSNSDTPGHGNFILAPNSPYDWRSPQNDNLWQGVNGVNNPCPAGFRLPIEAELDAERQSWSNNNAAGAFASPLKLPLSGGRDSGNGSLFNVGSHGGYWSSTVDGLNSRLLYFYSTSAAMRTHYRAVGSSVRCIKD